MEIKTIAQEFAQTLKEIGIKTIIRRTDIKNISSIRVLEKLNMHFWKQEQAQGIENCAYYHIKK